METANPYLVLALAIVKQAKADYFIIYEEYLKKKCNRATLLEAREVFYSDWFRFIYDCAGMELTTTDITRHIINWEKRYRKRSEKVRKNLRQYI